MINKKLLFYLAALVLTASISGAAEIFSLEKSIEYGFKHSPLLQGANIKIDQAVMDVKAQRGRFFPSIVTGYSHSRIFSRYVSGTVDTDYIDQENRVGSLRMTQPLFEGFENANRFEKAKIGKEYQKVKLKLQQLDLAYQIKATFFELLKTRYDITNVSYRILRLESDLAAAKAFSNEKIAAYVYVLQAAADLEEARQILWQARTSLYKHTSRLHSLLGLPRDTEPATGKVEFDDVFEVLTQSAVKDLDNCISYALLHRPEMMLFPLQSRMAEKDAAISRGRYYPRVVLDAGLYDTDKRYDYSYDSRGDQHNTYWSVGVSVQLNLFDGGTAYYESNRQRLEIQRIETEKKQIEMEIRETVGVAFHSLVETRSRLDSLEKALMASRENYERQKKRFAARIGTTSQVLDAQAMLTRAESGKSQALLDCQMALAMLYHSMGVVEHLERE